MTNMMLQLGILIGRGLLGAQAAQQHLAAHLAAPLPIGNGFDIHTMVCEVEKTMISLMLPLAAISIMVAAGGFAMRSYIGEMGQKAAGALKGTLIAVFLLAGAGSIFGGLVTFFGQNLSAFADCSIGILN